MEFIWAKEAGASARLDFQVAVEFNQLMLNSYKLEELKNERRQLFCNACQRPTIHVAEAKCVGRWDDEEGMFSGGQSDYIFRCGACDEVSFVSSSWDSENYVDDYDGSQIAIRSEKHFPVPIAKDFSFNQDHTPKKLNDLLHELMSSHAASLPIATTVMLRLIVEFIASDLNCKGRSLKIKIDDMKTLNLIDEEQRKLFQKVREHGNSGAHGAIGMSSVQILAAMSIINLIIEKHYNAPGREKSIMLNAQEALK